MQAQSTRERLWHRGSFLEGLSHHIDVIFRSRSGASSGRPHWSAIVSTASKQQAFPSWLACKLDLDEEDGIAEMDNTHVDVTVAMVDGDDGIANTVCSTTDAPSSM